MLRCAKANTRANSTRHTSFSFLFSFSLFRHYSTISSTCQGAHLWKHYLTGKIYLQGEIYLQGNICVFYTQIYPQHAKALICGICFSQVARESQARALRCERLESMQGKWRQIFPAVLRALSQVALSFVLYAALFCYVCSPLLPCTRASLALLYPNPRQDCSALPLPTPQLRSPACAHALSLPLASPVALSPPSPTLSPTHPVPRGLLAKHAARPGSVGRGAQGE